MRKGDIEKSLKRFLKRKVSYSLSLLIAFMITGGISFGEGITTEEIHTAKSDLLTKIQVEREEIKRKLAENERLIREYDSEFVDLVKRGDFYSKPSFNSTQIFLTYQYLDSGKMKDRTEKEFSETITAINKYYGLSKTGAVLKLKTTGNLGLDKVLGGNGVAVDDEVFRETVEVGANIVPIEPILPEINKSINIVIGIPSIGGIPTLTAPVITSPSAPAAIVPPSISVSVPGAIGSINVTAPSVPSPSVPDDKNIIKPSVTIPNAVDPTMVVAPESPSAPDVLIPEIPEVAFSSKSIGNGNKVYVDAPNGINGFIGNISVINGKFAVTRDNTYSTSTPTITYGGFTYSYKDYVAYTYRDVTPTTNGHGGAAGNFYDVADVTDKIYKNSNSGYYTNSGTGVQVVAVDYAGIYNNGDFVYTGKNKDKNLLLREFVHMDNHGAVNSLTSLRKILSDSVNNAKSAAYIDTATGKKVLDSWDDAIALSQSLGTAYNSSFGGSYQARGMMWVNSGKIIMEGGNLSLTNQYKHTGTVSSTFVINTDEVVIRPYYDGTTYYDAYNSGFLISNDNAGTVQQLLYNSGDMKFYTNDSGAYTINSGGTSALNILAVNRGTIEMTGKGSLGIYAKSTGSTVSTLYMDFTENGTGVRKPIVLYGDSSIGLYITDAYKPSGTHIYGNFHVDIGDISGTGNKVFNVAKEDTNGGEAISNYYGDNTNTGKIEGSVGILSYKSMNLSSHGVIIYNNTENSIGIVPITTASGTSPTLTLGTGSVEVLGGESNIGMIAMNIYNGMTLKNKGGSIISSSELVLDGGKGNSKKWIQHQYERNFRKGKYLCQ